MNLLPAPQVASASWHPSLLLDPEPCLHQIQTLNSALHALRLRIQSAYLLSDCLAPPGDGQGPAEAYCLLGLLGALMNKKGHTTLRSIST